MTSPTLTKILEKQAKLPPALEILPPHKPEILLIGCVDARLDIKGDLGIPKGKALIFRNIAAFVKGRTQEELGSLSVEAALEFAVNVMRVKDIVVMGHTDCGGIRACLAGDHHHQAIEAYLKPLEDMRTQVLSSGGNETEQARAMEQEAVRESVENLMSYEVVSNAVAEGRLELHGWVIDTATQRIKALNTGSQQFEEVGSAAA